MIVLCSDYVGYEVLKHLVDLDESIDCLVLDSSDKNNFNEKITKYYKKKYPEKTIYYEDSISDENFLNSLQNQNLELGILAWWPYILRGKILNITKMGWLNFHPSYLPYNKGKHPNFWCIVDETRAGVSLQFIDKGVDTGDIVAQKEFPITWEDTGKSVYEKSRNQIIELFKEAFPKIKNDDMPRIQQSNGEGTYHKGSEIDKASEIKLDENYTAKKLLNILRARTFPPHPSAFFYDNGKKYSVTINIKENKDE